MLPTWLPLLLVVAAWTQPVPSDTTLHRSEIRVRDPFVLADPETKTYYLYSSTTHGMDASEPESPWSSTGAPISSAGRRRSPLPSSLPVTGVAKPCGAGGASLQGPLLPFRDAHVDRDPADPAGTSPEPEARHGDPGGRSARGPFVPLGKGSQTPPDWMALDGTLWVEDGVPYMVFCPSGSRSPTAAWTWCG